MYKRQERHVACRFGRYAVELQHVRSVPTVGYMRWNYVGCVPQNPGRVHRRLFLPVLVMHRVMGVLSLRSIDRAPRTLSRYSHSTYLPLLFFYHVYLDKTDNHHWPGAPFFHSTLSGAESYAATSCLSPTDSACLYRGLPDIAQEPRTCLLYTSPSPRD